MPELWEEADYETTVLVDLAVDCIDKESDEATISGSDNVRLFERIMPILLDRIDEDVEEYKVSEQTLRPELRSHLNQLKEKSSPGKYFERNFDEFKEQIRSKSIKQYTIAFPLNYKFKPRRKPEKFSVLGYDIERIPRGVWMSEFKEAAEKSEKERNQTPGDDPFTSFIDENPNEFSRSHTYWTVDIEARDEKFAVDRVEKITEYLLGKINCAAHVNKKEGISIENTAWQSGWSNLRLPFVYLVFEEENYANFYYSTDLSPRKKFSVHGGFTSQYDHYLEKFPELEHPLSDIEETFVETIRRFQSAISEPNREDSFLDYWRGVESLTLTDETDDMKTVIQRAAAPIKHKNPEFFRFRLKRARETRNALVHEGVDISVNKHDQNLLKSVLENLIWLYCENIDEWQRDEFKFYLDNVKLDTGHLKKKQSKISNQMNILDRIIETKQYEPSGLEKVLTDWAGQQNELEDADFLDPFGFFVPVFGVGSTDADVMVVSQSPIYPADGENMIRKRSQVRGWQPNTTLWTLEKIRDFCENIVKEGNPDDIWDVLTGIASAIGQEPEDLYYTTLQKDGRFDESLDETEDDYDPIQLNEESITKWKPYLMEEIEEVEPELIVIFGEETLEAVVDLLSIIKDESSDDVPREEIYVLDKYPIIWFDQLTEIVPRKDKTVNEYVETILEGEEW